MPTTYTTELDIGRAVRKLDRNLLPLMTIFFFLSFLDRTNIGNARVAGLQHDLHLTEKQYQISLTTLFIPYLLSEVPSTLLLKVIGPKRLFPSLLSIWGLITCLQGFVTGFKGLLAARFFLGIVEGPVAPGIFLYLSGFYTRSELGLRYLTGAFSGFLSAAISFMDGLGGKRGWSWIFIIEGLLTFVVGVSSFFLITPTLAGAKFLTAEEKGAIASRLQTDRPIILNGSRFTYKEIKRAILSPHVVMSIFIPFFNASNLFGLSISIPSIVNSLGFSPVKSQLLAAGPFICAFFVTLLSCYISDKFNCRSIPIAFNGILAAIGFTIYICSDREYILYASLYPTISGTASINPLSVTWTSNNSEPHYRRATAIGLMGAFASSGGVLSTWTYPRSAAPKYQTTNTMNLTFALSVTVIAIINALFLSRRNREKQDPVKRQQILAPYHKSNAVGLKADNLECEFEEELSVEANKRAWLELGDRHPDFKYTL
ncbi:hypothetical protein AGABI1DRAFT_122806 [Agaricus bisporus var. burnettii JB137-S8]|uniref:Major facilitator superfamily (MFS) profile domain-containing protein n=1 Tax=Agaricus bisporus var. burnettii (strain JB137-S8 / ATCC MYA-4627 / FGSC 10392) TaxID=597362 RepID=K5X039_AGABU|nr:uncharacterized protein AGABI1DRAFT_122806 [Agaricus bisporus var. burnettii JB137-S8]EKM76237.1 hypothetical protein AGABI1DRAFT_122806 [Agaricus bisporus var. burnettii JB137-S8]